MWGPKWVSPKRLTCSRILTNKLKFSEKHLLSGHVYKNRKRTYLLRENNVNLSFSIFCGSPV